MEVKGRFTDKFRQAAGRMRKQADQPEASGRRETRRMKLKTMTGKMKNKIRLNRKTGIK